MSKIPNKAKRVFKGVIFDVYQWPQKMFDGSTETFEMLRRPDTACVIALDSNGMVIIADEEQPTHKRGLTLPIGRLDEGEKDPQLAAARELLEETGYSSAAWKHICTINPEPKLDWQVHYYLALNCVKVAEPHLDAGEKIDIIHWELDDFMNKAVTKGINLWDLEILFLRAKLDPNKWQGLKDFLQGKRDKLPVSLL